MPYPYALGLMMTNQADQQQMRVRVVGIGASAGGLQAFTDFISHLPTDSGLAFVLVQHLSPQQPSLLAELLANHTHMPVLPVVDQTPVAADHVYLIPPNTALTIAQGVLHLEPPTQAHGQRLPINHFFHSLAADQGAQAIGIVLSGTGSDGTLGLAAIKAHGGLTLAQTPASAAYPAMPQEAISAGVVDEILDVAAMPARLLRTDLHEHSVMAHAATLEGAIGASENTLPAAEPPALEEPAPADPPTDLLTQAPQRTRASLEATIYDVQGANVNLTAANEELRSLNEEFQAANEELQTSKEEIQSINEELKTVNTELSHKITELDRANADLANLFVSTEVAAVFLHADGRIARFTPKATNLFAMIAADLGRPITDLKQQFSSDGDLWVQIMQVFTTQTPTEQTVHHAVDDRWWNLRIMPYRTLTNQVDGVVLAFIDTTTLQRADNLLQQAHAELEQRVRERTNDLDAANTTLQGRIAELARSEQARQQLLQQLFTAQEEERHHIARELHDQMGQELTALVLSLKTLQESLRDQASASAQIDQIQALVRQIGEGARDLAVRLRPSALDDLGLGVALSNFTEQWSAQAKVAVDLHTSGLEAERLPLAVETTIYRLVQEALTNVLKHAHAREVSVIIERNAAEVHLIVEDDGVGFTTTPDHDSIASILSLGLLGMRERVALLGGTLTIETAPGSGVTIFTSIPLANTEKRNSNGHDNHLRR